VNVVVLQVFVSLMLVAGSVLLFAFSVRHRDYEHSDRLSLFPLEDDTARPAPAAPESQPQPPASER
jgi:hypothetical protein